MKLRKRFTEKEGFFIAQAHRSGVENARLGVVFSREQLDRPAIGGAFYQAKARAFNAGYQAELVRIANRRMTGRQRDLLIAHDRAAGVFAVAVKLFGREASQSEAFVRADMALFGLSPWQTLGITLGQYAGPAEQAGRE